VERQSLAVDFFKKGWPKNVILIRIHFGNKNNLTVIVLAYDFKYLSSGKTIKTLRHIMQNRPHSYAHACENQKEAPDPLKVKNQKLKLKSKRKHQNG